MWAPGKPQTSPARRSTFRSNLCSQVLIRSVFPAGRWIGSHPRPFLGFTPYPSASPGKRPQPGTHSPEVTLRGCDWVQHRILVPSAQEASSPLTGTSPRAPSKLPDRQPHLDKRPGKPGQTMAAGGTAWTSKESVWLEPCTGSFAPSPTCPTCPHHSALIPTAPFHPSQKQAHHPSSSCRDPDSWSAHASSIWVMVISHPLSPNTPATH